MNLRTFVTSTALALIALPLVAALAGCSVVTDGVGPTPGPVGSHPATTPSASPTIEKVLLNCNLVLTDAHAAALTPPLKPIATFTPAAGSLGATMVAQGARACGWGADSTASLEAVVAIPTAAGLKAAKGAAASTGQAAPHTQADAAYYEVSDGTGQVQIFMGSYWILVRSAAFTSSEQAEVVYETMINDLRSAGG